MQAAGEKQKKEEEQKEQDGKAPAAVTKLETKGCNVSVHSIVEIKTIIGICHCCPGQCQGMGISVTATAREGVIDRFGMVLSRLTDQIRDDFGLVGELVP